jgi:hypothetical protein
LGKGREGKSERGSSNEEEFDFEFSSRVSIDEFITPPYPAYQTLKYVSSWEVRNEVWHDYRLDEEAQAAGYKIRSVSFSEDLLSIRVTK